MSQTTTWATTRRDGIFSRVLLLLVAFAVAAVLAPAAARASVKRAQDAPESRPAAQPAAAESPVQPPAPGAASSESGHEPAAAKGSAQGAGEHPAGLEEASGEAEAGESVLATVARLFNFALLVGALVYLLRSPFGQFLDSRKVQIRKELTTAAETREAATRQLASIDAKLKALPAELEALRERGTQEIAAEEGRIREASEVERTRMLEAARREIDRRAQLAERRLTQRAGELAVNIATERVKKTITTADQARLLDRYLEQVRPEAVSS